ncbi:MAG: ABC-F family ATP-binding cassette domain-containing protein [Bacteroidales bacterium]|nr:ABC-F family ATP-binding cassette domain-containing protein [Bacteroidales bacterium]
MKVHTFAPNMYSINNISIHFTGEDLFSGISFMIHEKERIGLVGRNGAGKTTLLRIICGIQNPHEGEVVIPQEKKVGYLPQELTADNTITVRQQAMMAFTETDKLERRINEITEELSNRSDYESNSYKSLIDEFSFCNERFAILEGANRDAETEKVLLGLGYKHTDFDRPLSEFSGGWQARAVIAKLLLEKPGIILLDEPTNHLDIESIEWLEEFLINYPGAVVLVSHDRAFLDNVTHRTIEIARGKIYDYKASYSNYLELRAQQMEQQQAEYSSQQREIREVERFIDRFRYKATKAKQVQSRIKKLEKMEVINPEESANSTIHFRFPPAPRSGKVVVDAKAVSKRYGNHEVLRDLDFAILKNDYIAFVGKNGEGKTTLARMIIGELEYTGEIKTGYNVSIGYFAQNQAQLLDGEKTLLQTIEDEAPLEVRSKARGILGAFLFSGDDVHKKVKVLSGGEKSRLALAKLLLNPVNFLILDEPTNHLDIRSKDILKSALLHFDGTVIVVSHDRDFLQGLTNKVFEFKNRSVKQHFGDVYDFLEKRKIEHLKQLEKKKRATNNQKNAPEKKTDYLKKKELEKTIRKLSNRIANIEASIADTERNQQVLETKLANPLQNKEEVEQKDFYGTYAANERLIKDLMEEWETLHSFLEEAKRKIS